jgi:hypothetical protein
MRMRTHRATRGLQGLTEEVLQHRVAEEARCGGGSRWRWCSEGWRWAPAFSAAGARRGGEREGGNQEQKGSRVALTSEGGRQRSSDEFSEDNDSPAPRSRQAQWLCEGEAAVL